MFCCFMCVTLQLQLHAVNDWALGSHDPIILFVHRYAVHCLLPNSFISVFPINEGRKVLKETWELRSTSTA